MLPEFSIVNMIKCIHNLQWRTKKGKKNKASDIFLNEMQLQSQSTKNRAKEGGKSWDSRWDHGREASSKRVASKSRARGWHLSVKQDWEWLSRTREREQLSRAREAWAWAWASGAKVLFQIWERGVKEWGLWRYWGFFTFVINKRSV